MGAGCVWIDVYTAVTTRAGRYVQGGGCATVGVAGLIQSGGFGSFSKAFGNAASGLIEAEVVTADGRVRRVNACADPDLFWALKGGGGGSFGVVTRLTLRTHDLPEFFGAAWGTIARKQRRCLPAPDRALPRLLRRQPRQSALGRAVRAAPGQLAEDLVRVPGPEPRGRPRGLATVLRVGEDLARDFTVTDELGAGAKPARSWWDVEGNRNMVRDQRAGASPGHGWWEGDQDQVGELPARL